MALAASSQAGPSSVKQKMADLAAMDDVDDDNKEEMPQNGGEDEEEDEDDFDWEEVPVGSDGEEGGEDEEELDGPNFDEDDGMELTIELDKETGNPIAGKADDKGKGKAKKKRSRTNSERMYDWRIHCGHVVALLCRGRLVSKWSRDEEVVGHILSVLPMSLYEELHACLPSVHDTRRLLAWFRDTFEVLGDDVATESEGREGSPVPRLIRVVEQRAGCGHELVQVFIALCYALGWRARYMLPLDPLSYLRPPHRESKKKGATKISAIDLSKARGGPPLGAGPVGCFVWVEVFCGDGAKDLPNDALKVASDSASNHHSQSSKPPSRQMEVIEIDDDDDDDRAATSSKGDNGDMHAKDEPSPPQPVSKGKKRASSSKGSKGRAGKVQKTEGQESPGSGEGGSRWVHVDLVRNLLDQPVAMEGCKPRRICASRYLQYVIGFDHRGRLTDLTKRYTAHWSQFESKRSTAYLNSVLKKFNARLNRQRDKDYRGSEWSMENQLDLEIEEQEKRDMRRSEHAADQVMPKTQEAFKRHPVYVLEKFLNKFECIYPYKPAGIFKGHKVFLRANIYDGRSAYQWKKMGRLVREDELDKAAKVLEPKGKGKRKKGQAGGEDDGGEHEEEGSGPSAGSKESTLLYVLAQTEPYKAPEMVGGVIPKNEHGNIEVWGGNEIFVPKGAVYIQIQGIEMVAKRLGIDYASALIGFDVKKGRPVPVMHGVVVALENRTLLLEAYHSWVAMETEKAAAATETRVAKNWEKLTRGMLIRRHVQDKYGGAAASSSSSSIAAATTSSRKKVKHTKPAL